MSKSALKILPGLVVAITVALLTTQPAFGGFMLAHEFQITENSSTSLTVTYDGSPLSVNLVTSDRWTFSLPTTFISSTGEQQWTEPENSSLVNLVNFGTAITRAGSVESDSLASMTIPTNPDRASILVGTDGGVDVFATFTDLAAASESAVPDTGTTFSLLGLSLLGLALVRRKIPA